MEQEIANSEDWGWGYMYSYDERNIEYVLLSRVQSMYFMPCR